MVLGLSLKNRFPGLALGFLEHLLSTELSVRGRLSVTQGLQSIAINTMVFLQIKSHVLEYA